MELEGWREQIDEKHFRAELPESVANKYGTHTSVLFIAASKRGENSFRKSLIEKLKIYKNIKHGHISGVTPEIFAEGMDTDYSIINRLGESVKTQMNDMMKNLSRIALEILTGEDSAGLKLQISKERNWVCDNGMITPGDWGNFPAGEVYTCPGPVLYASKPSPYFGICVDVMVGSECAKYGIIKKIRCI